LLHTVFGDIKINMLHFMKEILSVGSLEANILQRPGVLDPLGELTALPTSPRCLSSM